ncbi:hypothetical protein P168DRAFT_317564 [Aspergillus campestris IBT 28561]|uniref:GIY-YIG domain-containing protein n=1 Tax=Aspergillus campestris (strain IBT 28561) TaxID=1392248 RepID=A0A2I1D886_ASPC2|nr:uncharacterized protein P168DRAFT_317564 [Aspergillus campestris IBT 28561]PKY06067.1 hypothetical protein P168DRAFT_317564 [Aspergillus campestris IBT 28561]
MDKPIPPLYACYLLRSVPKPAALYIGSTPHPPRRLAQHNGVAKGGAKKTANDKRPWEMVIVVEGFMSRVSALQFEWAWQHPHDSRHTATEPGQITKRRGRRSLTAILGDLHRLLLSTGFCSAPLAIRFFAADVYRAWTMWIDRDGRALPPQMKTIPDGTCPVGPGGEGGRVGCVDAIPVDSSPIHDYLEKAHFLLDDPEHLQCRICREVVNPLGERIVVCPQPHCHGISHLLCLSARFLHAMQDRDQLVPTEGDCPACQETVSWPLMMKELTLRTRDAKTVQKILRKRKKQSSRQANSRATSVPAEEPKNPLPPDDVPLADDWTEQLAVDSDSSIELPPPSQRTEIVISDSE